MHVESVDTPSLLELRAMVARRLRAYAAFEGCTVEDRRAILAQACLVIWHLTAGGDPHARVTWRVGSDCSGVVSGIPCLFPPEGGVPPRHHRRSGASALPLPPAVAKMFRAQHTGYVIMAHV
jgi:hypothetical protein